MTSWHKGLLALSIALFAMATWALWYMWHHSGGLNLIQVLGPGMVIAASFAILRVACRLRPRYHPSVAEQIAEEEATYRHLDVASMTDYALYYQGELFVLDPRIQFFEGERIFKVVHNGQEVGSGTIAHHGQYVHTEAFRPSRVVTDDELDNSISCLVRTYTRDNRRLYQRKLTLKRLQPHELPT